MRLPRLFCAIAVTAIIGVSATIIASCGSSSESSEPHVAGKSKEEIGRYLVLTAGCNDCHTPGWKRGADVPEQGWLTGVPEGWRGPWGTTYASNLRLAMQPYTEESFVKAMKSRNGKPPMPWRSLHAMTDGDLGSIYAFIKSLGPAGENMPAALPPGKEPQTAYLSSILIPPHGAETKPK
jgi:hypothetical protein